MGKMSRDKGARFERKLAAMFREEGYDASRSAQHCGRTGLASDVTGIPGLWVEAKHCEQFRIYDWMAQAVRDATAEGKGNIPTVIYKKNNCEVLVTVRFEDFMKIYREWECGLDGSD